MSKKRVKDIDQSIGERLRAWRTSHGYGQKQVAEHIGITYQQLHKYEQGINRLSISTLLQLCDAYDFSPMQIIEGFGPDWLDEASQRLAHQLLNEFLRIDSREKRELLCHLAQALAQQAPLADTVSAACSLDKKLEMA